MDTITLQSFAERARRLETLDGSQVCTLLREVASNGIMSDEEAECLIDLDHDVPQQDASWADALCVLIVDYVVWTSRPTGHVDAKKAQWLISRLDRGQGPTVNGLRLAFDVIREAVSVDESLILFRLAGKNLGKQTQDQPVMTAA